MIIVWHMDPAYLEMLRKNMGRKLTGTEFMERACKTRTTSAVSADALVRHFRENGHMSDWFEEKEP